jgi:hypothetical protein
VDRGIVASEKENTLSRTQDMIVA